MTSAFALSALLVLFSQAIDEEATTITAAQRLAVAAPELAAWPNVTLEGYSVSGRRPNSIREAINRSRPRVEPGPARYDASTVWRYSTRWRTLAGGECDPASAEVAVAITVTLPDLAEPDRLSRRDRAKWDAYFGKLAAHELNHARIATRGVEAARDAMRAAADCDGMKAALERVSAEVSAASQEYDRLTDHGKREGAVYP